MGLSLLKYKVWVVSQDNTLFSCGWEPALYRLSFWRNELESSSQFFCELYFLEVLRGFSCSQIQVNLQLPKCIFELWFRSIFSTNFKPFEVIFWFFFSTRILFGYNIQCFGFDLTESPPLKTFRSINEAIGSLFFTLCLLWVLVCAHKAP